MKYNPDHTPDPETWLALPEDERLGLILNWHEDSEDPLPESGDWHLHAALQLAVENQLAMNEPKAVRPTLERLMNEGLDRHSAVHVIAGLLAELTHEHVRLKNEPFDNEIYDQALTELSVDDLGLDEPFEGEVSTAGEPNQNDQHFTAEQQHRLTAVMDANREQMMGFPETAGFLFAVVSCPEPVMPSEWFKAILGDFEFSDLKQAEVVTADLMALNNWIIKMLDQGRSPLPPGCEPAPDAEANFDESLTFNRWTRGFCKGHGWLEESWDKCATDDDGSGMSLMCLTCFSRRETAEAYRREIFDNKVTFDQMITAAHDMLPQAMQDYHYAGRHHQHHQHGPHCRHGVEPAREPVRSTKIGRNEPCPCGSGRKYKKCCGQPGGPTSTSIH